MSRVKHAQLDSIHVSVRSSPEVQRVDTEHDMSELNDFNQRVISEFRANQGKVSGQLAHMPVLLLTMTGARSGRTITKPLVYTTDGDRLVVIASFAGAPKNPPWYHNLVANPVATIEVGSD